MAELLCRKPDREKSGLTLRVAMHWNPEGYPDNSMYPQLPDAVPQGEDRAVDCRVVDAEAGTLL